MSPKFRDNLTFSEALHCLQRKEFKMMRYRNPVVSFEGPFYQLNQGHLCTLTGHQQYQQVDMNNFTFAQLSECCWHVSSPGPPHGWHENATCGGWYKPGICDVWVNIFYNYKTGSLEADPYKTQEIALSAAKSNNDSWFFIKTCHLSQQFSIPWRDV